METAPGIPGTVTPEAARIRWHYFADVCNGKGYQAEVPDGTLIAILSQDMAGKDGRLLWHLSVSFRDRNDQYSRCPTWDELKVAFYQLVRPDIPFVLIFPKRSARYVDIHPTTLHLWEAEGEIDQ
jgi:hypothetical protein